MWTVVDNDALTVPFVLCVWTVVDNDALTVVDSALLNLVLIQSFAWIVVDSVWRVEIVLQSRPVALTTPPEMK